MKGNRKKHIFTFLLFLVVLVCSFVFVSGAFAEEGTSVGRKIWDNVMLFFNFGILVFLFIKFVKKPMMDYLRGVGIKIGDELNTIKGKKEEVQSSLNAEAEKMKDIDQILVEAKARIVEAGEREKEKIIEQAKISAEKMIEDAKAYADYQIARVKKALSDEMVDIAIAMVEERLTKGVSEQDNEKIINQFIVDLETSKVHFN